MWLLEHEGAAFRGKRLWLRPGKRYLFGRTVAEPGMLAISGEKASSVSRKHITISVDDVREGDSQKLSSRSKVTVEDLGSKIGTTVNGHKIKKEQYVITQDKNELRMGSMSGFQITWMPVVLSFSFTRKELDAGAYTKLRQNLEHLDLKFLSGYDMKATTHVVSKKRNTSKGLQALVNGAFIVDDKFVDRLITATTTEVLEGGVDRSPLEADFDGNWPNAMDYLPDPGNEPVTRPAESFAPNPSRAEVFDGYTFIFYDQKQHETLVDPITNGKGKALYKEVIPGETEIDDFIRFVKSVAGEKGLGEFEDGSEGKGVVVVRCLPTGSAQAWYEQFYTDVSLRLDHRLIDQKDFLDAILSCDASSLRRPLEIDDARATQNHPQNSSASEPMNVDNENENEQPQSATGSRASAPRRPTRAPIRKRFKGFVADSDSDDGDTAMVDNGLVAVPSQVSVGPVAESSQEGLFVSQDGGHEEPDALVQTARGSQRKRPASRISQALDIEEDFAPTAAQLKRRRIETGQDPIPRQPTPSPPPDPEAEKETQASKGKKPQSKTGRVKKEIIDSNVIELARKRREEEEARARAEREDLEAGIEDLDLAEIRRLQLEEPMELRKAPPPRTREEDVATGRWDPAWNGRKNFKKFQQRGAAGAARPPQRIIVALEEVKAKGYGMGDDYWLEDESGRKGKKKSQRDSQNTSIQSTAATRESQATQSRRSAAASAPRQEPRDGEDDIEDEGTGLNGSSHVTKIDTVQDDDDDQDVVFSGTRKRSTRAASTQQESSPSQRTTQRSESSRHSIKRSAGAPPPRQQPAKRPRRANIPASDDEDEDESEDELRFRFKRR
ncbi:uncharacterized protein JN550_006434 [Neoarthrinium moseri]|uniref:uncharacterized protein n=1 Tax=Neoarthrinium moseri TaxID=1658444 RepID=UPI001FDDF830|nr:uncharacterized protein JN550_006434 [Neoarthrinium moseri]KAI1868518.1 hypothetical protein JN550_006434 [Neoarthrinium moseri]